MDTELFIELCCAGASIIAAVVAGVFGMRAKTKEAELQKELDKAIALNSQLTYIRNSRFDYEFKIYKELSQKTFRLTSAINTYLMSGFRQIHSDDLKVKEHANDLYKDVQSAYYEFRDTLFMSGAFISEEQFIEFENFMDLCFSQLITYDNDRYLEDYHKHCSVQEKAQKKNDDIIKAQRNIIESLRIHLAEYMPTSQN